MRAPIPGPESYSVGCPPFSPFNKTLLRCSKTSSRALLPKVLILKIILCSSFCYFHMALKTNFSPFLCSPLWVNSCCTTSALISTQWSPLSLFFPTSHLTMVSLFTRFQLMLSSLQNTIFKKNSLHLSISVSSHGFSNVWFLPILRSAVYKSTPPRSIPHDPTKLTSPPPVTTLNLSFIFSLTPVSKLILLICLFIGSFLPRKQVHSYTARA